MSTEVILAKPCLLLTAQFAIQLNMTMVMMSFTNSSNCDDDVVDRGDICSERCNRQSRKISPGIGFFSPTTRQNLPILREAFKNVLADFVR